MSLTLTVTRHPAKGPSAVLITVLDLGETPPLRPQGWIVTDGSRLRQASVRRAYRETYRAIMAQCAWKPEEKLAVLV